MASAIQQVIENRFVIPEEIPANERTAFHGAAAAAAKAGKKSFNFGGKTHPVTMKKDTAKKIADEKLPEKKKHKGDTATMNPKMDDGKTKGSEMEAKESKDLDAANVARAIKHDCATHVEHAEWGAGECISGQHTIVETSDGEGYVTHYDVMFEHGIEKDVPVAEMKVIKSSSHMHDNKKKKMPEPKKESRIRTALKDVLEKKDHHTKGATDPEEMDSKDSPSAKKMKADHKPEVNDTVSKAPDDARKAGQAGPSMKMRGNDNKQGDKNIVKGGTPMKNEDVNVQRSLRAAYASMYAEKKSENELDEDVKMHTSMAKAHDQHGNAHESEVTNGGHDDHDHASTAHHNAADAHKAAAEAHKKHGGDSSQYKAAASKAKSATVDAKDKAGQAGAFKKVAKPKASIGGPSPEKAPSTSPASRGVKAPGFTKMKMTNKGLQPA